MRDIINPDALVDVCLMLPDQALTKDEKILSFVRQSNGDPYCVLSGKFTVTQGFDPCAPTLNNICQRFLALPNSTFPAGGATMEDGKG